MLNERQSRVLFLPNSEDLVGVCGGSLIMMGVIFSFTK